MLKMQINHPLTSLKIVLAPWAYRIKYRHKFFSINLIYIFQLHLLQISPIFLPHILHCGLWNFLPYPRHIRLFYNLRLGTICPSLPTLISLFFFFFVLKFCCNWRHSSDISFSLWHSLKYPRKLIVLFSVHPSNCISIQIKPFVFTLYYNLLASWSSILL